MRAVMLLSAFLTFFSYAADVQLPRNDGVGLESLIETKIDRKEFEFEINKKTWKANNPIQRLSAQFDAGQLIVHSNNESNPTYLGLRVTGIGRDGAIQPVGSSRIRKRGERIEFDRQIGVTEWWKNGAKGLEQGFDIESQLSGEGILRIEMEIDSAEVVARGNDIIFKLSCGRELVFGKLKTLDANKNEVASSFETCGKNTFAILVNDINAQYPIQVDPTLSDAHWASGFGLRGVNGDVNAIALGTNGSVYVGGKFSIAGETAALNVAKWDGTSWSALGSGLSNTVRALAFYNNNLYAAGDFTSAGGIPANRIAKWDGTAWSALGAGVNDVVQALTIDASGAVYAGGSFTTAGGGSANRIAKWNGTAWSALGTGTSSTVYALLIDGSDILAGGAFGTAGGVSASRIARWNGTSWSSLGSGPDSLSTVYSIAKDSSNNIYVTAGNITSVQIRKWNGTAWSNLGSVLGFSLSGTACLDISNGDSIYLGGVTGLFIWTGTAWTRRNTGAIRAIKRDQNGNIYAGGQFYSNNSIVAANIAKWDATTCYALGQGNGASSDVNVLKYDSNGNLYVAGNFSTIGGIRANGIAKWDGVTWSSLGSGVSRTGGFEVRALEIDSNGHIYIGGLFSSAGGVSVGNIAKWDGTSWSTLSTGVNNSVYALSIDNSGNVYAGGNFTTAGGVTINRISKWNGTAWSALSTGMSSGIVYALTIDNSGSLYAGGTFTSAGGVSANRIAKWNGTAWAGVGSGASSTVFSLLKGNDGLIYAGGAFTTIGSVSANGIAAWNGTSWLNLGTGLGATVSEIVESNGVIYASSHSSTPTTKISIWDGVQWQTPYSGISGQILALAKTNNQPLYVGGSFSITGDKASSNFAKWINNEPVSNPPANTPASYSIGHTLVASTGDWSDPDNDSLTFTYRWIRADNDVGLNAAFISGATAPQYILTPNDAGRFVAVEVTANDGAGGISSRVSGYSYVRPVVTFSPNTLSVAENAGSANLTVTLSHSAGVETRVSYNVVGGNASGGVDYSLDSGVLVFAQGEISKNIPVALFNDAIDEFDETVEIILSNEENVDLVDLGEQKDHTLTILDDDLEPTVGLAALGEDSVGEADGIGSFWVFLSAPSEKPITVNYTFLADPNDITATDGTFTFEPQQVLGFIQFAITDDILDEGEESVGLTISNPVNAVLGTEPPLIDSASKFIIDDDRVFSFSVETSQIAENQAEAFVTIRVSTPMAGLFHLSVNLSVSGTALSPGDYAIQEENLGEMLFLQGEIEKVIPISINNDVLDEPNETIVFTLSNPRSGKLGLEKSYPLLVTPPPGTAPTPPLRLLRSGLSHPARPKT
jgi:hypothetical protein